MKKLKRYVVTEANYFVCKGYENDAENIFYTLDKNGFPTEIKHGDLRIETNIRNSEEN